MNIEKIRESYTAHELREEDAGDDPVQLFAQWMNAAVAAGIAEPNGIALATVPASVRIVLLRGYDHRGFVFYTNYESAKGLEIAADPRASFTVWWQPLHRQIRVSGHIEKVSGEESDAYFASRPRGHRISAWASAQSSVVAGRAQLAAAEAEAETRFPGDVPRPPHWGGYRLVPLEIEFWQGRENRLHDRLRYRRQGGAWLRERLSP
jgi:pyridoxamine 5'-phosphate oxidase